jgi:hypothetical protein
MLQRKGLLLRLSVLPVLVGAGIAVVLVGRGGNGDAAAPTVPQPTATKGAFARAVGATATGAPAAGAPIGAPIAAASVASGQPCPKPAATARMPAGFPESFPLPAGTVLTIARSYRQPGLPRTLLIQGYAPISFRAAVLYFIRELPRHGYTIGRGDSENREAEASIQGHGVRGAFKVGALSVPCPNLVAVLAVVSPLRKTSQPR